MEARKPGRGRAWRVLRWPDLLNWPISRGFCARTHVSCAISTRTAPSGRETIRLRDRGKISAGVLRALDRDLDLEEEGLGPGE